MIHYELPSESPNRERSGFSAVDIMLPTSAVNAAEISLTSRYPERGYSLNTKSEMIVRVLEGDVEFESEGESVALPAGSTVLVQRGRPYCWKPKNFVKLFVFSTPPWTPEQYKNILE